VKALARKEKRKNRQNGLDAEDYRPHTGLHLRNLNPLTENQRIVFETFNNQNLLLHGLAGTGKSMISLYLALSEIVEPDSPYKKLIIIRSTVPTREMGFLPGGPKDKSAPYEAPYMEICTKLYGRGDAYGILKTKGLIEFTTTSFVRGITLDNCIVFVDEIQNCTLHELDSVVTRAGNNCKMVFSGDFTQTDFLKDGDRHGVLQFMKILKGMGPHFSYVEFGENDIVRSKLVKDYIITKKRLNIG
jgi:predicted ribonuclease YlaK